MLMTRSTAARRIEQLRTEAVQGGGTYRLHTLIEDVGSGLVTADDFDRCVYAVRANERLSIADIKQKTLEELVMNRQVHTADPSVLEMLGMKLTPVGA
jgi:hypothetical protein